MRLDLDGVAPMPRMLLLDGFPLRAGFRVGSDGPVLVAAGDRVPCGTDSLVATRPTGEQDRRPIRDRRWSCRR